MERETYSTSDDKRTVLETPVDRYDASEDYGLPWPPCHLWLRVSATSVAVRWYGTSPGFYLDVLRQDE